MLGCEPQFGRDWTEVVLPATVLDARLPTADAVLFRVLDRQLAERVKEVTPESPFADRVCKVIVDYLHRERLSLAAVARIVGCSERTLQRRLTDAGTSFRGLVDEARRSRARRRCSSAGAAVTRARGRARVRRGDGRSIGRSRGGWGRRR